MRKPLHQYLFVKSPITKILIGIVALGVVFVVLVFQAVIEPQRMQAQTGNWDGRSVEKGAELFANNCSNCHGADGRGLPGVAPALNSHYFFTNRTMDVGFSGSLHDYVAGTVAAGRPSKALSQWAQKMPTWGSRYGGPLRDDQVVNVTDFVMNWQSTALLQTPEEDPWVPFQDAPMTAVTGEVTTPAPADGPTGEPRPPQDLFVVMGCGGCHVLDVPQDADNRGPIGPNMGNLAETAANRVPGEDAPTYVHTSIVDPNAYVVEGYQPNIMPQNFQDRMSEEEINALVEWLLSPDRAE
jgi:mono/diheme cytochrome c family protein